MLAYSAPLVRLLAAALMVEVTVGALFVTLVIVVVLGGVSTRRKIQAMSTAQDDLKAAEAALLKEVTDLESKEVATKAYILGVPAMVSAAVAAALTIAKSGGGLDDNTAEQIASDINGATSRIATSADDVVAAIAANTPPTPAPAEGAADQAGEKAQGDGTAQAQGQDPAQ